MFVLVNATRAFFTNTNTLPRVFVYEYECVHAHFFSSFLIVQAITTKMSKAKREKLFFENDEDLQEEESYFAPLFEETPSKKVLDALYIKYRSCYGRIKRKLALTVRTSKRYMAPSEYFQITEDCHFALANTHEVARNIEVMMIKILNEHGDYLEHADNGSGTVSMSENSYHVYLVGKKTDDDKCPICHRTWIDQEEDRIAHFSTIHARPKHVIENWRKLFVTAGNDRMIALCDKYLRWPYKGKSTPASSTSSASSSTATPAKRKASNSTKTSAPKKKFNRIVMPSDSESD